MNWMVGICSSIYICSAEFETQMTTLTNRFRNGWNYYVSEGMCPALYLHCITIPSGWALSPGPPLYVTFIMSVKSWARAQDWGQSLYISSFLQSQKSLESELAQCEERKKVFLTKGNCVSYNEEGGVGMRWGILSTAASEQRVCELTALVHQLQLQQQGAHNKEAVSREIWEQVVWVTEQ